MIKFFVFRFFGRIGASVFLLLLLLSPAIGQDELIYPNPPASAERDAKFKEARELMSRHSFDDALQILLEIADENSGNSAGGQALISAITVSLYKGDSAGVESLRNRVFTEYPGSYFEFIERIKSIDSVDQDFIVEQREIVVTSFGLPSIEEILNGDQEAAFKKVEDQSLEIKEAAATIYGGFVMNKYNNDAPEDALKIAFFGRRAFDPYTGSDNPFNSDIIFLRRNISGNSSFGREPGQPTVTTTVPEDGGQSSPLATVEAIVISGDTPQQGSLDLQSLEFKIDGQDVRSSAVISSLGDIGASEGALETVKVSWQGQLTPGTHQASLKIAASPNREDPPEGPASTSVDWSFTVSSQQENQSIKVLKDSTLRAHKPHRNEGANPRLFLSHRLEARNKSQNPLVGFDLSEADLNGLSKATLVMSIQDCDLPRRWGKNGRFIEAHALTASWVEGNGNKHRVNGGNGKTKGEGQGVTWFSPADDQIRNNRPDGSQQWMGGRSITAPLTAPAVQVLNRQTGPIEFDVTQDVLQAASLGNSSPEISWLLKKQDESKFGNIRFYSKEGAAQAGDETLAPTLILEYGGQTAQSSEPGVARLLSKLGLGATQAQIELSSDRSEVPSLREQLKESPVAGFMGEALVSTATGANPVVSLAAQTAYRAWVS